MIQRIVKIVNGKIVKIPPVFFAATDSGKRRMPINVKRGRRAGPDRQSRRAQDPPQPGTDFTKFHFGRFYEIPF
jgi:hypothetical protein